MIDLKAAAARVRQLAVRSTSVTLSPPGPSGTQRDADPSGPHQTFRVLSTVELADVDAVRSVAASYGFAVQVTLDGDQVIEGDPTSVVAAMVDFECRHALGIIEGAVPNHDDARLNDLERQIRNQGRSLNRITSSLQELAEHVAKIVAHVSGDRAGAAEQLQRVVSTLPPSQTYTPAGFPPEVAVPPPVPIEPSLTPQQQQAAGKAMPLIGTPVPFAGDMTAPINPRARGAGRTPEMASGMMQTHGPSATSTIITATGRTNDRGEPVFESHPVPLVGNTLQPMRSDIVTGGGK